MAKIRIRLGQNEIEVDSRDFYVDNQTLGDVVSDLSAMVDGKKTPELPPKPEPAPAPLSELPEAEVFEPEFSEPVPVGIDELPARLLQLAKESFFDEPRTVSETAEQLREHGWSARQLDVSKTLARMTLERCLLKNSRDQRSYYSSGPALIAN